MKNRPHNLTKIVFACSIAALCFSAGLYIYMYVRTEALIGTAVVAAEALRSSEASRLQSKDILAQYDTTAADRAALASAFVPSDDQVAFIQAVETIKGESGSDISISSIRAVSPDGSSKAGIGSIQSTIVVRGSWQSVMKAIELFEAFPYASSISSLNLAAQDAGPKAAGARPWLASLDMSALTLAAPATSSPAAIK